MFTEPPSLLPFPGGLRCFPEEVLRQAVDLAQAKGPVSPLTAAVIVHLQGEQRGFLWLARMAEVEPARALWAALEAARLSFTYRPDFKVCLLQLQPSAVPFEVFAALRRGFDAVGGREACEFSPPENLALRAGVAWVFPERPLWSDADRATSLLQLPLPPDPRAPPQVLPDMKPATEHFLAASIRDRPQLLGKPITAADDVAEEVLVLAGEPAALARFHERRLLLKEAIAFETLADADVSRALLEGRSPGRLSALHTMLARGNPKAKDLERWLVALERSWSPAPKTLPDARWTSPFSATKHRPPPPPAPPLLEAGGTWARAHRSEHAELTEDDVEPTFIAAALEDVGVAALPVARRLTRARPNLLAEVGHIDDLQLAVSWVGALSKPLGGRGPGATAWLRTHPALAVPATLLAFFEADPDLHRGARVALSMLERTEPALVEHLFSTLSSEQRAYVTAQRAPPPLGKAPRLPAFVELSALPPVLHRDGATELSDQARLELAMALKLLPVHDSGPLMTLTSALASTSLTAFAGALALAWFRAGAPSKERWAVDALAHFGDDGWATALGALADKLIPERYAVAQALMGTLAHLPSRHAVGALLRLAKSRTASIRKTAGAALEQSAAVLGLSPGELADQLVPDAAPQGFSLGKKPPASADSATKAEWRQVSAAARDALARVEGLMVQGATMGAQVFLETWLLKPVLRPLADTIVWGLYQDGARVGLRCGKSSQGVDVLSDDLRVRPVHRLELNAEELNLLWTWVKADEQPFQQLGRPISGRGEVAQLQRLVGREATRARLKSLELRGWPLLRIERLDGVERRGPGWRVRVQVNPPFFPGGGVDDEPSQVVAVTFEGAQNVPPVLLSELQYDLNDVFR
jgi:hypothetical protein